MMLPSHSEKSAPSVADMVAGLPLQSAMKAGLVRAANRVLTGAVVG